MAETTVSKEFYPVPEVSGSDRTTQLTFDPETKTAKLYLTIIENGKTIRSELYNNGIWNTEGQSQFSSPTKYGIQ